MAVEDKRQCLSWFDSLGVKHGKHGISNEGINHQYDKYADKYDQFFLAPDFQCKGFDKIKMTLSELCPGNRDGVLILDIGAGTGNLGTKLQEAGFTTQDALEPSANMLEKAKEKGIYRHMYNAFLTDQPLDIPSDMYDAVVMQGVIGPGTVPVVAFKELTRIAKPGGYIVLSNRAAYLDEIPDYKENWGALLSRMEQDGRWKVLKNERYLNQFMDHPGVHVAIQVR